MIAPAIFGWSSFARFDFIDELALPSGAIEDVPLDGRRGRLFGFIHGLKRQHVCDPRMVRTDDDLARGNIPSES